MFENLVAYEASAGSGKTFALTIRYISLLFLGAKPERILTLTFTNKAANEMRERVENSIKNLHKESCKSELKEISNILNVSEEKILSKQKEILNNFLKSDIYILTIDKFCTMILRKFSLYVGLLPDFTIERKKENDKFITLFIKTLLLDGGYEDFVKFAYFEGKKLNPILQILDYFYAKSIDIPLVENVDDFSEDIVWKDFKDMKCKLFECDKLSNRARESLNNIENILQIFKSRWFCKDSLEEYRDFKKCYEKSMDKLFYKLKEDISGYFKYRESKYIQNLYNFLKLYVKANYEIKKKLNDLSFSDIANFTHRVLYDEVDKDFFYFRLDAKFDHILIDEFQDTSIVQYEILKPLFEEIVSGEGVAEEKSLFYVGDVKQSIYRFRGGSKELFYHVANEFGLDIEKLYKNYRSKKVIVDFVNSVFKEKIEGYFDQEAVNISGGYVKVIQSDDLIKSIIDSVIELRDVGISESDIAILTYTNDDAFLVEAGLKENIEGILVSTDTSVLIKNNLQAKAIIEAMKYVYFKEPICRANFLSLVGSDIDDELDISEFYPSLKPAIFIKMMMDRFGFCDEAVFEFLQKSYEYSDLEEFLFAIDDFNDEVSFKELKGVKILTIHKSKGLEFKHLLLCDRLKAKRGDRSSFIVEEDNLKTKRLYLKVPGRECVDNSYADAMEKEKKMQYEDELNLKYVALTRAKESLFIFKKRKSSSFDDIDLQECEMGKFPNKKEFFQDDIKMYDDFIYKNFKTGKQEHAIVSKNENNREKDFKSIAFGTALHYMLEMLDGFKKESLQSAFLSTRNRYEDILGLEDLKDIKERVLSLLDMEFFRELIKNKRIYQELPLFYEGELKQLDLLLEDEKKYIVIDYKSSEYVQNEHKEQVGNYKRILKNLKDKNVIAYLCYLKKRNIEFIEV